MTGAAASDTAIGHAQAEGSSAGRLNRIHTATARPPTTAAAAPCGVSQLASHLKSGPLKRMKATTLGTAPSGSAPADRNGRYSRNSTAAPAAASLIRIR